MFAGLVMVLISMNHLLICPTGRPITGVAIMTGRLASINSNTYNIRVPSVYNICQDKTESYTYPYIVIIVVVVVVAAALSSVIDIIDVCFRLSFCVIRVVIIIYAVVAATAADDDFVVVSVTIIDITFASSTVVGDAAVASATTNVQGLCFRSFAVHIVIIIIFKFCIVIVLNKHN